MILLWISLITLITTQHVRSKVIKINTAGGSDNTTCCVDGECVCSSLSTALCYMASNTIINITSQSVTLGVNIRMGSGDLNNITIAGNGATIMCNNSGGVYCESCDHVVIEGITWDRCGDPNGTNAAGLAFRIISNILLLNCTFQYSQVLAVCFLEASKEIVIQRSSFIYNSQTVIWKSNCGGLNIKIANTEYMNLVISESYFIGNSHYCNGDYIYNYTGIGSGLSVIGFSLSISISIKITRTSFFSNNGAAIFQLISNAPQTVELKEVDVFGNTAMGRSFVAGIGFIGSAATSSLEVSSSLFGNNNGCAFHWSCDSNFSSAIVSNTSFVDNGPGEYSLPTVALYLTSNDPTQLTGILFIDIIISNCTAGSPKAYPDGRGVIYVMSASNAANISFTRVHMYSNKYLGFTGGTVFIESSKSGRFFLITFNHCNFVDSYSPGRGAALCIDNSEHIYNSIIVFMFNCSFSGVTAIESVVYMASVQVLKVCSTNFTNCSGSSLFLSSTNLQICESVLFKDNTADNGAALYMFQKSVVYFIEGAIVHFVNNLVTHHGGAIFVNPDCICSTQSFQYLNGAEGAAVLFANNSALNSGNSIYFTIPNLCQVNTNISDPDSIMHLPCQFYYSQSTDGELHNCTTLNDTRFPIVTSPHELRLYFPNNDGVIISSISDYNMYVIFSNILGHRVMFTGATFDYFGKPAEPTEFYVKCMDCNHNVKLVENQILVDNATFLGITFVGEKITGSGLNVSIEISSTVLTIKQITTILIVELLPCSSYPGTVYNAGSNGGTCVCYQHNVDCTGDENVIKRGYWFGSVGGTATTSLCPNHYCKFIGRNEIRQGFYELPHEIDAQCENHRSGIACGECSPRHILAFGSADCISVHHCNAWMILSVAVLIILYWVLVTVGVFGLSYMYNKFDNFRKPEVHQLPTTRTPFKELQISSGYIYGVIYYYSMVGILLDNNPYIPHGVLQFVYVLSSFAQLTPQFPGPFPEPLCSVHGLSRIDQLFFRYLHPIAVLLIILLIIGLARTRCAARRRVVVLIINHSIIDVFCLLLLLSYTSIASTSLQLLQPLWFTDIDQAYTYVSPDIQFFHGRHLGYGIVAIIFIIFIVIGLPLLLLLEPRIGIGRQYLLIIKPLLDKFRECYKIKYQWFAFYFLLCRVVIMATVFVGNKNYYNMLFYLQSACMLIAMVHIWIQPYRHESLNALDGIILLALVLVVNINTFPFLHNVVTEISVVLVTLPLLLVGYVTIRKAVQLNRSAADYDDDAVINYSTR